jgi:hypothetical protein
MCSGMPQLTAVFTPTLLCEAMGKGRKRRSGEWGERVGQPGQGMTYDCSSWEVCRVLSRWDPSPSRLTGRCILPPPLLPRSLMHRAGARQS